MTVRSRKWKILLILEMSANALIHVEVALRINKASSAFGRIWMLLISTVTKLKVYNAVVLPALIYKAETWIVYQAHAKKPTHFHLSSLRKILRIKWQNNIPDIKVLQCATTESVFYHLRKIQLR